MKMSSQILRFPTLILLALGLCLGCSEESETSAAYPQRPIKLIVPFGAGGGSDTFSRILVKAIEDHQLLPQPIVIINVPGAGGTIGSRRVKNARPDGYTLMQLHEGIVTSKYSGRVNYGPEAFDPIAGMGKSIMVIGVGEHSPYQSLNDLMKDATKRPDEVVFSANIGAPSQFAGLMLEKVSSGAKFRYAQTGDGAKRFAGLQGGHTDVSSFSLAEYIQFKPSGLRAIALLGTERHPDAQEIPTAIEQGFDVVSVNMQFWWAPKGTSSERLDVIAKALSEAMKTDEVQARLSQLNIDPVTYPRSSLTAELKSRADRVASVAQQPTISVPNFPAWIFGSVVVLAISSVYFDRKPRQKIERIEREDEKQLEQGISPRWIATGVFLTTIAYVAMMHADLMGYQLATFTYLICLGALLASQNKKMMGIMVLLAVVLSVGLHFVFTQVFVIDLP